MGISRVYITCYRTNFTPVSYNFTHTSTFCAIAMLLYLIFYSTLSFIENTFI